MAPRLAPLAYGKGALLLSVSNIWPDTFYRQSIHPSNAEQIVYFIVTNVDCDLPSINSTLNPSDVHLGLSAGELGCWVDTTVTRVTQTGVEHVRIPDASAFLSA